MLSIITMASSTTNPVDIVNAMSNRLLRLYPSTCMTLKLPMSESGTATAGMMVTVKFRRKQKSRV
jgi:hypothetical protein